MRVTHYQLLWWYLHQLCSHITAAWHKPVPTLEAYLSADLGWNSDTHFLHLSKRLSMFHHNWHLQVISWQWNKHYKTSSRNRTNGYGFLEYDWSKWQFMEGILLQSGKNCNVWTDEVKCRTPELSHYFPPVSLILAAIWIIFPDNLPSPLFILWMPSERSSWLYCWS